MDDSEERPSKIRKLDSMKDSHPPLQYPPASSDSSPTNSTNKAEEHNDLTQNEPQVQTDALPTLSKKQLKKHLKTEQWEAGKEYRKAKQREKQKEKKARNAEQRAQIVSGELSPPPPTPAEIAKKNKSRPARPIQIPVSIIFDCSFDGEFMTQKELISLGAQLTRCYSDNRSAIYRSHMAISSWGGKLRERFEMVLAGNHFGWKGMRFYDGDFLDAARQLNEVMRGSGGGKLVGALADQGESMSRIEGEGAVKVEKFSQEESTESNDAETFTASEALLESRSTNLAPENATESKPPDITSALEALLQSNSASSKQESRETPPILQPPSLVYLTSDSPNTLSRLSPNTCYIIGGIVDKNRHKGLCYKLARDRGIPTAKLPIGEYMTMQSRSVLAVNHVAEIMLRWLEKGDWGEAFLSVIPKRKEAKLRVKAGKDDDEDDKAEAEAEAEGNGDEAKSVYETAEESA